MSRSLWKGPFVDAHVLKKAEAARESGRNDVLKFGPVGLLFFRSS